MGASYRVDEVHAQAPRSHADFVFGRAVHTLTRLDDGRQVRIDILRRPGWTPGRIVAEAEVAAAFPEGV